jgi:signal transduction histidine kinase
MYPDKLGNWWLASKNGLIVFNEKENTFKRFTTGDGLAQNDVDATLFCTEDNTMIIGANNYFSFFKPGPLINASLNKKNAILTEIRVNNKIIDGDPDAAISLGYKENNIVIRWALPDYGNPLRNQYYVKMEGIDEDWHYVGNLGEVQYANLSDGHYSIRLKAATANEVASENIIPLKFIIHPPIWKRGWFITLLSLILLSSFILIVRYISQRNLKEKLLRMEKEQAIEKERNRISRDMHDDLGSGLTKIAILSEVVKKQLHEPEKAKQQLETIGESSRELVDNLQDIIWVLNPKNDTLESLAAYIREYALKFFEPFGTIVQFNYPEKFSDTRLSEEARRNVFLTIKETFNNTGKHAWNNKILISIEQSPSSILVKIEDDGKGFDISNIRQFGNGLANMKNRIEQLGGVYKIESEPGKGTRTVIEIPL